MTSWKNLIPSKTRSSVREFRQKSQNQIQELKLIWRGFQYSGTQVNCPCCGGNFREFLPFGVQTRKNAQCPRCLCLERHRLLWLYFQEKTNLFKDNLKVLHIAPEKWFQKKLKSLSNLDYLSADLDSSWAMENMDITDINYPDNTFDVILCNHVLEHIPDDHKAMQELYRVLKQGGWAILQVPMDNTKVTTFEDKNITSPEERLRFFGQQDHVRIYGQDYKNRLENAGFKVKVDQYVKDLDDTLVNKYGLKKDHDIYFCSKVS